MGNTGSRTNRTNGSTNDVEQETTDWDEKIPLRSWRNLDPSVEFSAIFRGDPSSGDTQKIQGPVIGVYNGTGDPQSHVDAL